MRGEFEHATLAVEIMSQTRIVKRYVNGIKNVVPENFQVAGEAVVNMHKARRTPMYKDDRAQLIKGAENEAVVSLYLLPKSLDQVGAMCNRSGQWAKLRLVELNIPRRGVKNSAPDSVLQEFLEGATAQQLALKHNCSDQTIYRKLHSANIKPTGHYFPPKREFPYSVVEDYTSGKKSVAQLAEENSCKEETIRKFLKRKGVKLKMGGRKKS